MPMRATMLKPSTSAKTLICIDSVQDADFSGRFCNAALGGSISFNSATDLIFKLDWMCDTIEYPHAVFRRRSFYKSRPRRLIKYGKPDGMLTDDVFAGEQGKELTVILQLQTRMNATWQGTVCWLEQGRDAYFQSVLELFGLLEQYAEENGRRPECVSWDRRL